MRNQIDPTHALSHPPLLAPLYAKVGGHERFGESPPVSVCGALRKVGVKTATNSATTCLPSFVPEITRELRCAL